MLAASLVSLLLSASPADPYVGTQAVRAKVDGPDQARWVEQVSTHLLDERLGGAQLDVIVDAAGLDALASAGIEYRVLEPNVHARIVAEQERIAAASVPRDFDGWFEDFKTLDQIQTHVDELAALAPEHIEVTEIGSSLEGRPIRVVRLGDGDPDKPAVVITGVQHAREWLASMVPVCVIDRFARDGETDPTIAAILDRATVYVIPIVNPDGFFYTWESDRYWRKNRRDGYGVDLNRNWSAGWGKEMGASPDTDSDQYHGPEAFSEPETQAVRDFVQSHPEVEALIDFHAFAGVVASSYAHTDDPPTDIDLLRAWGDGLADQINEAHDYGYRSLHGEDANHTIGYAAGTQPDWAHDEATIHGFTIELRPRFDDEGGGGFEVPPETIIPTCEENTAAVLDLARWASSSDEPAVAITRPADGAFFPDAPALTEIDLDVEFGGPLSRVNMYINGELQTWDDTVFPHHAEIDFPRGTWELVAEVETWDGQVSVSAPVTVYVGDEPPDDESGGTDGGTDGGEDDGGTDGGDGEDDPGEDDLDTRGCGCSSPRPAPASGLLLLALAAWRRRR
jgi:hypothetical protein